MSSLILFGLISFRYLGISELPDVDFPIISISTNLEGASPEVMESDVIDVIENAVMGVEGLKDITSSARYGSASITLEFDLDRDIDVALQEVQSKLAQTGKRLPVDLEPPVISKSNPEDQPIMWVALSGNRSHRELISYARDKIVTHFQLVPGVGEVFFGGYAEPNIRVWVNGTRLRDLELSVEDVVSAIGSEHVELPAGILEKGDTEYTLRVIGEARTPEELGDIAIAKRGGTPIFTPIRLKDIARVEAGLEDVRRIVRVLGETAVGMGIRKQRGTNAVEIAEGIRAKIDEIQKTLPEGLKLGVNFDSTPFIRETVHELQFELILSALLTAIVCWIFLGSWSATLNILLAIPTSLIGAFIAIKFLGYTLNTFTFLALTLAVGIVVDDAIMVLENIFRHKEMGKSRKAASLDGTYQISFAAMATTLAIVAIFLPVAFMQGVIGKFFLQFGVTISIAVMISLLEALTLTPMRCSQFMEEKHAHDRRFDRWMQTWNEFYRRTLSWALKHRWKVVTASLAVFISSLVMTKFIKKEFSPSQDLGIFLIRLKAPVGTSLEKMDAISRQAEEKLKEIPEIQRFFMSVGGFGSGQVNSAMSFVTLSPRSERDRGHTEIMDEARKSLSEIKGVRAILQDLSARGFGAGRGFPIEFSIRGPEWDQLIQLSKDMSKKLSDDPRFVDVDDNLEEGLPEVRIVPKREQAVRLGVSVQDIAKAVSGLIGGEKVARFTEAGKRIDVRIKLESTYIKDSEAILDLNVRNNRGELIRMREVAEIQPRESLASITRQQRERAITIYSNIAPKASQAEMVADIEKWGRELPSGYTMMLSGSSKTFGESFASLTFALLLGIIVAYMILASQFNSFVHGFTVLLALPFSLSGAWLALWLAGKSLNVYSMIGLILLMGIVKKTSILLVDFTNQLRRDRKMRPDEALMEACPTRLRPILMTSITIVSAALPSAIGFGPGSETRSPMALAVIGGVILSTAFTLYVVPCAYSLLVKVERTEV